MRRGFLSYLVATFAIFLSICLNTISLPSAYAEEVPLTELYPDMVVEWLKVRIPPEHRDLYLEVDREIWTAALEQYPGFIDKATWLSPISDAEVIFIIRWETREQWKEIPAEALDAITQEFDTAFPYDYEMIEEKEYVPVES